MPIVDSLAVFQYIDGGSDSNGTATYHKDIFLCLGGFKYSLCTCSREDHQLHAKYHFLSQVWQFSVFKSEV